MDGLDRVLEQQLAQKDFRDVAGYSMSPTGELTYPYVILQITPGPMNRVTEAELVREFDAAAMEEAILDEVGFLRDADLQLEPTWDAVQKRLTMPFTLEVPGVDQVRGLSVARVGSHGIVQINCYARASEFDAAMPAFQEWIDGVRIAAGYEWQPGSEGRFDFGELGAWTLIGALGGVVLWIVGRLRRPPVAAYGSQAWVEEGQRPSVTPAFADGTDIVQPGFDRPAPRWRQWERPLVDINTANASELSAELGLPEQWAEAIVETRAALGSYHSPEQLYARAGLPYELYVSVQDHVTVTSGDQRPVAPGPVGARGPARRTRPVAAVVLVGLGAAILVYTVSTGGFEAVIDGLRALERSDSSTVSDAGAKGAWDLSNGDCINVPVFAAGAGDDLLFDVPVVPCDQAHYAEVYWSFDLPDGAYPGAESVTTAADEGCYQAFARFVGATYEESVLYLTHLSPTSNSWTLTEDRTITCLVGDPDAQVSGTLRGVAR